MTLDTLTVLLRTRHGPTFVATRRRAAFERTLASCAPDPVTQVRELVRTHVLSHVTYPLLAIVTNDELHHLSPERATESLELRRRTELLSTEVGLRGVAAGVFASGELLPKVAAISSMGVRAPYWFVPTADYGPADLANSYAELAVRMPSRHPE